MKIRKKWVAWEELEGLQGGTWTPASHTHVWTDIGDPTEGLLAYGSSPEGFLVRGATGKYLYLGANSAEHAHFDTTGDFFHYADMTVGATTRTTQNLTILGEYQTSGFNNVQYLNFKFGTRTRWRFYASQLSDAMNDFDLTLQVTNLAGDDYVNVIHFDGVDQVVTIPIGLGMDANIDMKSNDIVNIGKIVFGASTPYLNATGLVADNKVLDSDKLDGQHGSYYAPTTTKLDDWATPDDNTDLNASTTRHGLLLKLGGGSTNFLRADGTWAVPSGGTPAAHASTHHSGGGDQVDHDSLLGFEASEHRSLPDTIGNVLSDHDKATHDNLLINAAEWEGWARTDYLDQAVKIASTPTFNGVGLDGNLDLKSNDIVQVDKIVFGASTPYLSSAGMAADNKVADSAEWDGWARTTYMDQAVKIASTPTFNGVGLDGNLDMKSNDIVQVDKIVFGVSTPYLSSVGLVSNNKVADSDKWDGYQFADYLDQAVKQASFPSFAQLAVDYVNINGRVITSTSLGLYLRGATAGDVIINAGAVDAAGGFKDNGVGGIDTTFYDRDNNEITVSGGIITAIS